MLLRVALILQDTLGCVSAQTNEPRNEEDFMEVPEHVVFCLTNTCPGCPCHCNEDDDQKDTCNKGSEVSSDVKS